MARTETCVWKSLNDFDHILRRSISQNTSYLSPVRKTDTGMASKTNCHHYRSQEVSVHHNSPMMAKFVSCIDVAPVTLFLAVQTYWPPLTLLETVWTMSTPLSGWLDTTGCPLRCHEKRAGGSESDMQVSCTVRPSDASPPPTHVFGVSLVSTGVSGPSGSQTRGDCYQHSAFRAFVSSTKNIRSASEISWLRKTDSIFLSSVFLLSQGFFSILPK